MALNGRATVVAFAALASAAACSSSTSPHGHAPTGITFVAGNNQTDTINAVLAQALVVRIDVAPESGQVVLFESTFDSVNSTEVAVQSLTSLYPAFSVTATTGASGEAAVGIVLGGRARKAAHVVVSVPALKLVDTATYTVLPGQPSGFVVAPNDTTMFASTPEQLRAKVVDHGGDSLPTTATTRVIAGMATTSGTTVSATQASRVTVVTTANGYVDTTFASFVPSGTFAGTLEDAISFTVAGLDGSGARQFAVPSGNTTGNIRWAPDGAHIVSDQGDGVCSSVGNQITVSDLSGDTHLVDGSGGINQYPSYSRDGTWIYFSKQAATTTTWRAHPDGSADDSVATQNPSASDIYPSPSPDGQRVAYIADMGSTSDLRILTLSTGAVQSLGVAAWSPQWSPTANQIAYITGRTCEGTISIVNADGSSNHRLTTGAYFSNFDWSPDGHWLLAVNENGGVDVIDATSGTPIPLTYITPFQFFSVTWKPK